MKRISDEKIYEIAGNIIVNMFSKQSLNTAIIYEKFSNAVDAIKRKIKEDRLAYIIGEKPKDVKSPKNELKYKILKDDSIEWEGRILFRIQALKDFGDVKEGDIGGFIECEDNLSQEGDCWVSGDALVYGYAKVYDNAWVLDDAEVYGDAKVYGYAMVSDNAQVYGYAQVYGNAWVSGNAWVCNAKVYGDAWVYGYAWVYGNAQVYGNAVVLDDAEVYGNAWVYGYAVVSGYAKVYGNAQVWGKGSNI